MSLPEETAVETPNPPMRRYSAIVVVKLPELEWMATDPARRVSSGWSPPSAPPTRTLSQTFATPRQLAPMTSTPASWQMKRMFLESEVGTFSVTMTMRLRSGL
jgi:hypothetical protein